LRAAATELPFRHAATADLDDDARVTIADGEAAIRWVIADGVAVVAVAAAAERARAAFVQIRADGKEHLDAAVRVADEQVTLRVEAAFLPAERDDTPARQPGELEVRD